MLLYICWSIGLPMIIHCDSLLVMTNSRQRFTHLKYHLIISLVDDLISLITIIFQKFHIIPIVLRTWSYCYYQNIKDCMYHFDVHHNKMWRAGFGSDFRVCMRQ